MLTLSFEGTVAVNNVPPAFIERVSLAVPKSRKLYSALMVMLFVTAYSKPAPTIHPYRSNVVDPEPATVTPAIVPEAEVLQSSSAQAPPTLPKTNTRSNAHPKRAANVGVRCTDSARETKKGNGVGRAL